MIFLPADNVESKCAILISAMISFKISRPRDFETKRFRDQEISRPRDLKTKIGDQTMMHRLTREENQPAVRRPAFSTAEAIAMSAMISRRGSEGWGLVLRIPHGTESVVAADAAGRVLVALRRAPVVGGADPVATAQQTGRASRGSCGVGHAY